MKFTIVFGLLTIGVVLGDNVLSDALVESMKAFKVARNKRFAPPSQEASVMMAFRMTDTNEDGLVSADEMINFLKNTVGIKIEPDTRESMRMMFGNGIDMNRFRAMYEQGLAGPMPPNTN